MVTQVCGAITAVCGTLYAGIRLLEWWKNRHNKSRITIEDCLEIVKQAMQQ